MQKDLSLTDKSIKQNLTDAVFYLGIKRSDFYYIATFFGILRFKMSFVKTANRKDW